MVDVDAVLYIHQQEVSSVLTHRPPFHFVYINVENKGYDFVTGVL